MDTPKTLVFDNPNNVTEQSSDNTPVMSDASIAQANTLENYNTSPAVPHALRAGSFEAADALADRGAPRDLDTWANQHGELDELTNDKSAWDEEAVNMRGMQQSKMRMVGTPTAATHNIVQAPNGARIAFPKEMPADQMHQEMSTYWDRLTKDNPLLQGPVDSAKFLAHEVHGAAQTIIGLPSAIVDSIVVEPTEHEKQQFGITGKPSRAQQAALAMYRNIGAPIENAAQWYGTAVKHNQRIIDLIPADVLAEGIGTGAGAAVLSKFIEGEGAETPAMGQETPTTAAATYAGTERRAGARTLTTPAENELAMKNRRLQDISNPFDHTEGASATIKPDIDRLVPQHPEAKGQTFYHGANAEGTKAIERTGAINPDAFSQAHLTPEKSTADAYARANGGKTFSVNEKDIPPDVLQQYKDTGRGPMVLNSEHTVPVNEAAPQSALAPEYKDLGNGLHEVSTPAAEGSSNGHLLARDVEGNPDAARVGHHWVDADSRGQGMGSAQLAKMAQSLADKGKTTLLSDLDMTAGAKRSWDNLQTQYPDAVSKAGNGYIFDLTKLKPDADAEALKNALSGSAGENALFEKAKAELGPDATASEVAQRAQEMKSTTAQLAAHEENGGSTFTPEGKNLIGEDKYSVGAYPDRTEQVDNLTPERLQAFKAANKDLLSQPDHAVGTWKDSDTGKHVLDVTKLYDDRDEAIAAGKAVNQKSIYHLGGEGEIKTGGTGEGNPPMSVGAAAGTGAPTAGIPESIAKNMMGKEVAGVTKTPAATAKFLDTMSKIPEVQEYIDIAIAGEGARKWYQRSSSAFDGMAKEAPQYFSEEGDKEKFLGMLAGSSPRQSVAMNLRETLSAWKTWVDAGRPALDLDKWQAYEKAGRPEGDQWATEKMLADSFTPAGTKVPNIIKAMNGQDLWPDLTKNKNFKVPSFHRNLMGWLNESTNDGWMSLFAGLDPKKIADPTSYHPMSIATRAAAHALGWETAEAQAAIWSFTQSLTEKGEESPGVVRQYSEDFSDLMAHDPQTRAILQDLGVQLDKLDEHLRAIGEKPEVTGRTTATTSRSIGKLKGRIEAARGKGYIPPPKSAQGSLGFTDEHPVRAPKPLKDSATDFNPEDMSSNFKQRLNDKMTAALA